ncbi:MAG: hypothetical protein JSW12_22275 [Deltaproteobacteria bacterium]|nr:MAG: hypothetical protein JSW12_22275 [Deltaproteobacteria bacterium]
MFTSKSPNISALNHGKYSHVGLVGQDQRFWQAENLIKPLCFAVVRIEKGKPKEKTVLEQEIHVPLLGKS